MKLRRPFFIIIALIICCLLFVSCDTPDKQDNLEEEESTGLLFTKLDWNSSVEDVITYHNSEPSEIYDAQMGDKAYKFVETEYDGISSNSTYFFTDEGKLVAMWFDIDCKTDAELKSLNERYISLYSQEYGKCDFSNDQGEIWYTKNVNICITPINILRVKMIRIQYSDPGFDFED